ncbi:MAG: hypothetical protein WA431_06715 [Candidatus Cybelea sp.]
MSNGQLTSPGFGGRASQESCGFPSWQYAMISRFAGPGVKRGSV